MSEKNRGIPDKINDLDMIMCLDYAGEFSKEVANGDARILIDEIINCARFSDIRGHPASAAAQIRELLSVADKIIKKEQQQDTLESFFGSLDRSDIVQEYIDNKMSSTGDAMHPMLKCIEKWVDQVVKGRGQ